MTTDKSDWAKITPPPCNTDLWKKGENAGVYDSGRVGGANAFEHIILGIKEDTGVEIDWHYVGGRAVVRVMMEDFQTVKPHLIQRLGYANEEL